MAVHCSRAGWKELRSGVAEDQFGVHTREGRPVRFWCTIVITFLAAAMGAAFLVFGCAAALFEIV